MTGLDPPANESVALRRGGQMPLVGFGTWQIEGRAARTAVLNALEVGYRHIDTATVYRNERQVGRAIADSALARDDLFITTKLPGNANTIRGTLEQSLTDLGLDYVDLWLIHWPPAGSYERATLSSRAMYKEMLALRDEGLARAIGVSNYVIAEIDELILATEESPEVNQIPWSPFLHDALTQTELNKRGVALEGYSPFKTSQMSHPVLATISVSHGVSAAQVILRWHLQRRIVVIPKSLHNERIRENFEVFAFFLDAEEMAELDNLASS
jgi:2,5-diketo-D-gluconate reductase A